MVYHPEQIVNRYVWEQFKTYAPNFYSLYAPTSGGPEIIPFFPAPASNVPSEMIESNKPYIVFDKFTRVRSAASTAYRGGGLHSIKTDQMRYTIVGGEYGANYGAINRYASTIELSSLIFRILDREDDVARDINEFAKTIPNYLTNPQETESQKKVNDMYRYYFHNFQVYQSGFTDTQMDVDNFMEYNPSRDLIIRYDYHYRQFNEN